MFLDAKQPSELHQDMADRGFAPPPPCYLTMLMKIQSSTWPRGGNCETSTVTAARLAKQQSPIIRTQLKNLGLEVGSALIPRQAWCWEGGREGRREGSAGFSQQSLACGIRKSAAANMQLQLVEYEIRWWGGVKLPLHPCYYKPQSHAQRE